jgi:aldose 1-epimerase
VQELRFSNETIQAVVLPDVGARLHRVRAFGHDVLRTPQDLDLHVADPFFWGAYVMAPWCGRIEAGSVVLGSRRIALESNFPDGSAIHGQVYACPWDRRQDGSLHVTGGGDGWPWVYEVGLRIEAIHQSLFIEQTLINRSDDPMPAGIGIHPWFRKPLSVAIRGDAVHPLNTATQPEPQPEPVRGSFDLRQVGEMADDLDATWTDLAEPPVELRWPWAGIRAAMRITAPTIYVVAASPGHLDAIAVEPQTHAPQGLRRMLRHEPGGLTMLDPGQALRLRVELAFERLEIGEVSSTSSRHRPRGART